MNDSEPLDLDPEDVELPEAREDFLAALAVLGAGTELPAEATYALGGAAAARRAEAMHREGVRHDAPLDASDIARAFVAFEAAIGGGFSVERADEESAVVVNDRCPFGASVVGSHRMCRFSSAALGSLAARASRGDASVRLTRAIAAGHNGCRLTLRLGSDTPPGAHRYTWPPRGLANRPVATSRTVLEGHGIALALQLPRDRLSVPVIRHLARYALEEVGVTAAISYDIQLALSEACANVLDHAGPCDVYEVSITIRPERCELRITDTGRGFDHLSIREDRRGFDEERGRGLGLVQAVMDGVDFVSEPERGTLVTLVKRLEFDESSPSRVLLAEAIQRERADAP